jgi:N-acetylmuramoyl-L-alanine amidase CwlA
MRARKTKETKMKTYKKYTNINVSPRKYYGAPYNSTKSIKAIVIHWCGAEGTAKNNCDYFARGYVGASAHLFIDETTYGYSVRASQAAWSVGVKFSTLYGKAFPKSSARLWGKLNNGNTYSIEMCCKKVSGKLTVTQKVIDLTIAKTAALCKKWGLSASDVVMHYDVCGKDCPGIWMSVNKDPDKIFEEKFRSPLRKKLAVLKSPAKVAAPAKKSETKIEAPSNSKTSTKLKKDDKYALAKDVKGYYKSDLKGKVYEVKKGTYYVYNLTGKAVNLTSKKGTPGTWVKR